MTLFTMIRTFPKVQLFNILTLTYRSAKKFDSIIVKVWKKDNIDEWYWVMYEEIWYNWKYSCNNILFYTVIAIFCAVALFSDVMLAKGFPASPQQSRSYFGLDIILPLDFDPLWLYMLEPPAPPLLIDVFDIDTFSLLPALKIINIQKFMSS